MPILQCTGNTLLCSRFLYGKRTLLGAIRIPVRKEPNRCNLEPLKAETPKIALYVVVAQGRLTLQVV
jgi:hypothetical protein